MVDKKTGLKPKKAAAKKPAAKDTKAKVAKDAELVAEIASPDVKEQPAVEIDFAPTAKAGRRSPKALREAEAEAAKKERKAKASETDEKPKAVQKPTRSREERAGKKYREATKLIDKSKTYTMAEALDLATKTSTTKFDATVELHINLGVDPKQADQNVRSNVNLPAGTGRAVRVAVFAEGDDIAKAKAAGADIAGDNDLLASLDKEEINFDILVSSPNLMARLGKYAKVLGPKGLMPNPKSGTVTNDIEKAISEAKAGKVEFRVDSASIIHLGIGKVSFGADKLNQNAEAIMSAVRAAKPASLKGNYINSVFVSTSMGPSIKVAI